MKRVKRWKHKSVIDAMQRRLDLLPNAMGLRRRTVEHVVGTHKPGNPDWLMSDFERACKLMTSASAIIAPDRVVRSQDPNSPAICESVWKPSPTCFRMAASAPWLSPDFRLEDARLALPSPWRAADDRLPLCAVVGLTDPEMALWDAVDAAGGADVDLDAFPLLCAPLWAMAPKERVEISGTLPFLPG